MGIHNLYIFKELSLSQNWITTNFTYLLSWYLKTALLTASLIPLETVILLSHLACNYAFRLSVFCLLFWSLRPLQYYYHPRRLRTTHIWVLGPPAWQGITASVICKFKAQNMIYNLFLILTLIMLKGATMVGFNNLLVRCHSALSKVGLVFLKHLICFLSPKPKTYLIFFTYIKL